MLLNENSTYYDLLEVAPDATQQDIRAAYMRAKAAFKKDSLALYTLMSDEETEALLHRIEEAFQILSSPERRREYDRSHGLLSMEEQELHRTRAPRDRKIVSIDRVPPMDTGSSGDDLLVAPSTDFTSAPARRQEPAAMAADDTDSFFGTAAPVASPATSPVSHGSSALSPVFESAPSAPAAATAEPFAQPTPPSIPPEGPVTNTRPRSLSAADAALEQEIAQEVDWRGSMLRRVRDGRRVSIEEIAANTKITKTYILAIEDENYAKLPAAVYLRGFVTQIAKFLRLPHDKVSAAYMARFNQSKPAK